MSRRSLNIYIDDVTRAAMKRYPYVNWSAVCRIAINKKVEALDKIIENKRRLEADLIIEYGPRIESD